MITVYFPTYWSRLDMLVWLDKEGFRLFRFTDYAAVQIDP
jgi:hypothetical protein